MKTQVLFVILDYYADWEYSFLASALQDGIGGKKSAFEVKTLSTCKNPVKSIGGFTTIPDYDLSDFGHNYSAVFLIGGNSWRAGKGPAYEKIELLAPFIQKSYTDNKIVGAICDATVFLGMHGLLNDKMHTANTLEDLMHRAGSNYMGSKNYLNMQAVRDNNLVTANGTAYLEFAKECLLALNAFTPEDIEQYYQFFKLGYINMMNKADN